ncbi:MAG: Mpo1-like protein [Rubrivivax sp.]
MGRARLLALAEVPVLTVGLSLLVLGSLVQFIGHYYEGRRPASADDLAALFVGPMFVVLELLAMAGLCRTLAAKVERRADQAARLGAAVAALSSAPRPKQAAPSQSPSPATDRRLALTHPRLALVMGAGAIGCWVGGRLKAAGAEVRDFVGRPAVLEELRVLGLTLTDLDGRRIWRRPSYTTTPKCPMRRARHRHAAAIPLTLLLLRSPLPRRWCCCA